MFLSYEQVAADDTVKAVAALTIPAACTRVLLQADTANIRYTMDDTTAPTTSTGMRLLNGLEATEFEVSDVRRIQFTREGGVSANLNVHYFGSSLVSQ